MSERCFFLGTHQPSWLATAGVPLFVSRRRLAHRHTLPRAVAPWALDSGGFTELSTTGRWSLTAAQYAEEVRRYSDEIGQMVFAAPQDWMCEPYVLAKTGLSVEEHQRRTVDNYLELTSIAPGLPWVPVLQGWAIWSYWRHVQMYEAADVDLSCLPLVAVGSVCRRQGTVTAAGILRSLNTLFGLRLHGFGLKTQGLRLCGDSLASADSMAWSVAARYEDPMPGHPHKNCANCLDFALAWRDALPDEWLNIESSALARVEKALRDWRPA